MDFHPDLSKYPSIWNSDLDGLSAAQETGDVVLLKEPTEKLVGRVGKGFNKQEAASA